MGVSSLRTPATDNMRCLHGILALLPAAVGAWQTVVVPHSSNRTADDAPLLRSALASGNFSANTTILFQRGVSYNIFTPVKFPVFQNVEVAIEGNLTYPSDIATVQGASHSLYPVKLIPTLTYRLSSCCSVLGESIAVLCTRL